MFNVWTKLVDEIRPPKYQSHKYEYTNCEYEYKYSKFVLEYKYDYRVLNLRHFSSPVC